MSIRVSALCHGTFRIWNASCLLSGGLDARDPREKADFTISHFKSMRTLSRNGLIREISSPPMVRYSLSRPGSSGLADPRLLSSDATSSVLCLPGWGPACGVPCHMRTAYWPILHSATNAYECFQRSPADEEWTGMNRSIRTMDMRYGQGPGSKG